MAAPGVMVAPVELELEEVVGAVVPVPGAAGKEPAVEVVGPAVAGVGAVVVGEAAEGEAVGVAAVPVG
ncbi:hypothetical protein [Streptomyces cyaneofuscatus]|uniref:hypothetical protein n=1 Tax=Streptomyces cyaneofuscatus TaxID=66883 RepID=UPI0036499C2E